MVVLKHLRMLYSVLFLYSLVTTQKIGLIKQIYAPFCQNEGLLRLACQANIPNSECFQNRNMLDINVLFMCSHLCYSLMYQKSVGNNHLQEILKFRKQVHGNINLRYKHKFHSGAINIKL